MTCDLTSALTPTSTLLPPDWIHDDSYNREQKLVLVQIIKDVHEHTINHQ